MATEAAIQTTNPRAIEVTSNRRRQGSWSYRPNVDIFDTSEEVLLLADLPGADPERIDVSTEAGILTVQAEVAPRATEDARCVGHEYGVGSFHRRFEVDESIDTEAVTAEYRNGVLIVHLPKAPSARRRRIPVSA